MNRIRFFQLFLFLLALTMTGCAGLKPAVKGMKLPSAISLAETYRARAVEAEAGKEWAQALYYYKIMQKINPEATDILQKITALQTKIDRESDLHFKRGLSFYRRSARDHARKEFLTALRINPSHKGAKEYLLKKMGVKTGRIYYAIGKKTLAAVAAEMYNDPKKNYIIAYFNNLKTNATVPDGARLIIPDLVRTAPENKIPDLARTVPENTIPDTAYENSTLDETAFNLDSQLEKARQLLNKKDYDKALTMSKDILEVDPTNADAIKMENESYYRMGKKLEKKRQYAEALAMILNVDTDYKDTAKSIASLKKQIQKEAETHYRRGVRCFVNQDLVHAISEWKKTLSLDPDHKKAQKDMLKAETLLEKLKNIH
ncbi:MAG: hypothetical protein GXP53_06885 [Deltaproteobacteria bacterium]|nr:hypothetical protein [Deltaproteobacteria bacterium]